MAAKILQELETNCLMICTTQIRPSSCKEGNMRHGRGSDHTKRWEMYVAKYTRRSFTGAGSPGLSTSQSWLPSALQPATIRIVSFSSSLVKTELHFDCLFERGVWFHKLTMCQRFQGGDDKIRSARQITLALFLRKMKVGMAWMLYWPDNSSHSSTSTLRNITFGFSPAIFCKHNTPIY